MQKTETYKYYAFISYSSKDTKWGERLHKKLENYRIPTAICNEKGWKRKPIDPVFFAPYEIQPGDLPEELKKRLRQSRNLIVICSQNSAQSEWVAKEIAYFHGLGRTKYIYFFIIDGIPHSKEKDIECINPIIDKLKMPEILGANINEKVYRWSWLNRERAYVQLITKLLDLEFDTIWQRHKRMLIQHAILHTILFITFIFSLFCTCKLCLPVDVNVSLKETSVYNENLPQLKDAQISLQCLEDSFARDIIIQNIGDIGVFKYIPHKYLNKDFHIKVKCMYYNEVDTIITLSKDIQINISRDEDFYGAIYFELWDSNTHSPVKKCPITIEDFQVETNEQGQVSLIIPIESQKQVYYPYASNFRFEDSIVMPMGKEHNYVIQGSYINN